MPCGFRAFGLFLLFVTLIGGSLTAHALNERERSHLRMLGEWLPYVSCQDTKYLKQCFRWSTEECEASTEQSSRSCVNMYQAQWFDSYTSSAETWQAKMIDCVHRDIRAKLKGREISSILCQNKAGAQ